ncbi:hypothetical protein D3C86_1833920 [compost metagenome]
MSNKEQIEIAQCCLVFRQGVTAQFNGMNKVVITIHADAPHPLRLHTAWPATHICRVIVIWPPKIPHLELATFDKHHVIQ